MLSEADVGQSQNKYTLNFLEKSLETAFRVHHAKNILSQVRVAILIASALYAIFSILDFIVISENRTTALLVRFAFAIPLFALAYLATYRRYFRKRLQLLVSVVICIAGVGIALIAIRYENTRSDIFFTGLLLPIFWAFLYSGLRFVNAVIVSLSLICIYEILFLCLSDMSFHLLIGINFFLFTSFIIGVLGGYTIEHHSRQDFLSQRLIKLEKQKNEKLLLNILPKSIATELMTQQGTIARDYDEITVLFADLVGFSQLSQHCNAHEIVSLLNEIFSSFDKLTDDYGLEKIKTIGDAYMVTSDICAAKSEAVEAVACFALSLHKALAKYNEKTGKHINLRVGIHTGPAVAGVIGVKRFIYDIWGSTVNIASRMESHCPVNKIQVSEATYHLLKNRFDFEDRGKIEIKNMGEMHVYLLLGGA
ncbi:MAG TPA: adenylate/guanylate cyclase domain-containing protein [Gammaproteobacteria bacterium]|nr:adenylate/guanylate cyclase domain-containing protein [Gammaproteobacteria bacterium]